MNIRVCIIIAFVLSSGLVGFASAGEDVGPFGLSIGVSQPDDVLERFPSAAAAGSNSWTGGAMYRVDGAQLPLQGARRATFVFGQDDRLDAVLITLNKRRFDAVRRLLDEQYPRVSARIPHVGDAHVEWRVGDVIIELDSPHMSFDMQLEYQTRRFVEQFERGLREQRESRRQQEGSQL